MTHFTPPAPPQTIEETGLSPTFLINLVAKAMNVGGVMTPGDIAVMLALPRSIIRHIVEEMVTLQLLESKGLASADMRSDIRYALTERGRAWALDALAASAYLGPAPVTLDAFEAQVKAQSIVNERIHRADLDRALAHLVLPEALMPQIGPAVNCGRSVLLYGESGNGKTSIAEAMGAAFRDTIWLPHAILVQHHVIQFFDQTIHLPVPDAAPAGSYDARWVACRRPVVISGGELTIAMLDLAFEPQARVYEAPMHFKATGGVFIIDDFGRQRDTPQAFLNRWITPLEKGFDILALHTGKKFTVPFDQLVVFSTNIAPEHLSDTATLRRLIYKVHVPTPTREDYVTIFRQACEDEGLPFDRAAVEAFFDATYDAQGRVPSGAHPRFILRHVKSAATFLEREPTLSPDFLNLAARNIYLQAPDGARPRPLGTAPLAMPI